MLEDALEEGGFFLHAGDLPALTIPQEILLTGLLIMADWIASNNRFFPLLPVDDLGASTLYPRRVQEGWARVDLAAALANGLPVPPWTAILSGSVLDFLHQRSAESRAGDSGLLWRALACW